MLELPEAFVLADQINNTLQGKTITKVLVAHSPHKFAWFHGDPENYHHLLTGKTVIKAIAHGGMVEIVTDDGKSPVVLVFGDGVRLRWHGENEVWPKKHQLLVEFTGQSALSGSVQMYGGLWCCPAGEFDNPYYQLAKEKPSPLSAEFDQIYFERLINTSTVRTLSAKALLATEQRIPGLGNGVLQDILYNAKIHPKKKVNTFSEPERDLLFRAIKSTLAEMTAQGGRDTEKDLFGCPGGYITILSKNTVEPPCPACGNLIKKNNYLGGSIYYCAGCQSL